jgi:hypothetical protein
VNVRRLSYQSLSILGLIRVGWRSDLLALDLGNYFKGLWGKAKQNNRGYLSCCYFFSLALLQFVTSGIVFLCGIFFWRLSILDNLLRLSGHQNLGESFLTGATP